jgi:hypothetical protein
MSWRRVLSTVVMVLGVAAGCGQKVQGPERATIAGTVKLDGQPIEYGSILFTPDAGVRGTAAGATIRNGRYELTAEKGPTLGANRVVIRALTKSGRKVQSPTARTGEMIDEMVESVAPAFNSETKLKFEIKSGSNTADFEVCSK